ncbi:MAG TPA: diiron oxygenase [Mycobacteriales bacterium]|jgi:hypothetical protein|nr:diiron oxygenase [Mycobacteriales bacterium]
MAISSVERSPERRVERLSHVSAKRVIEPDVEVTGEFGEGQLLPDELLLVAGIDVELSPEQKATLAREQVAAMLEGGIRFESTLLAGAGLLLTQWPDLTDPRVTYLLHEVGEETRHSRLFVRMIEQLRPRARNPFTTGLNARIGKRIYRLTAANPLLFCTMVLAGEEIPDLVQRRAVEHPDTDDYLRRANAYHREEEARHLAFGRMLLPEMWASSSRKDRWLVRRVAPLLVRLMMETQLTHPGIYAVVGLPPRRTAWKVNHSETQRALVAEAMRGVLKTLLAAAPQLQGRVPRGWRRLCQVDRAGTPLSSATLTAE